MKCEDCKYAEISDWEQDIKTGKAKPIYWCKIHKHFCEDIQECSRREGSDKECR